MKDGRPSVLFVTSELPWPLNSGGHLRTYHLLRALNTTFDVRLIAGVVGGQESQVEELVRQGFQIRPVQLKARTRIGEGVRLLKALSAGEPYALFRRHDHAEMHAAVRQELEIARPALCYLDHLDSYLYARDIAPVPFVLDLHNIYSLILDREARESSRSWFVRRFLSREARLLRNVEAQAVSKADAVFAVSATEQEHFSKLGRAPVYLVPNGVDCGRYASLPVGRDISPPNILFVGTMSWPPNRIAVRFLAEVVLPKVQEQHPGTRLTVVGKNPGDEMRALASGKAMILADNVPEILPCLREATLLAVPLDSGGGTRLKILEAFAAGLPVVSTRVGCEGIPAASGTELLIAERDQFVDAVLDVVDSSDRARERARLARDLVEAQFDWAAIGNRAVEAIRILAAAKPRVS